KGGPSGGDGGGGGSIFIAATRRLNTLYHLQFRRDWRAGRGEHGMGSNCSGQAGEDVVIELPVGSVVRDKATGELIGDLSADDQPVVVADSPGLIEGAHEGHGLGHEFLRHVERCSILVHLVDLSANDHPEKDAAVVARELELHSTTLAEKPRLICGSKLDSAI